MSQNNYSSKDLQGLRVKHDINDFQEGQDVILTLKDTQIVENGRLLEDDDILENVEMAENTRREFYKQVENDLKKGDNDYFEEKFKMNDKVILAKYEDKNPEKTGLVLDSTGSYDLQKLQKLELIKQKMQKGKEKTFSLHTEKRVASDYYNAKPVFQKPSKKIQKDKKKIADVIDFLEENAEDRTIDDHGNRQTQALQKVKDDAEEILQKKKKVQNYSKAVEKAQEDEVFKNFDYEDEESQLQQSLEKQRRLANQKKENGDAKVKALLEAAEQSQAKMEEKTKVDMQDFNMMIASDRKAKEGKQEIRAIITSTEFLKNIPTQKERMEDEKSGYQTTLKQTFTRQRKPVIEDYDEKTLQENPEKIKEEIGFMDDDIINRGLTSALKKLRERGELEDLEEYSGRANDENYKQALDKFQGFDKDRIKLEYKDQTGRQMTPKEAFRYLCWTFHGKKPGRNKIEKKIQKEKMKNKAKMVNIGETPLQRNFKKMQEKTNQPFLVLSAQKKM